MLQDQAFSAANDSDTNRYRRVAVFLSLEVQRLVSKGQDGEPDAWLRDDKSSSPTISSMVNDWIEKSKATVVGVSPPSVSVVVVTADTRSYFVGTTVIYIPDEVVQYDRYDAGKAKETQEDPTESIVRRLQKELGEFQSFMSRRAQET